jgi:hypothetical protein
MADVIQNLKLKQMEKARYKKSPPLRKRQRKDMSMVTSSLQIDQEKERDL